MPFTFIIVGLYLIIAAAKGQSTALFAAVKNDLSPADGSRGFVTWAVAMLAVGALGYIPRLQTPARLLMALIIVSLLLSNTGFFAKLQQSFPTIFPATTQAGG